MPIRPDDLMTGGALQGAVAQSLLDSRQRAAALAIGQMLGAYRVVRELGRGGMAIVDLAERDDGEYQQQVALKWMQSAHPGEVALALFEREPLTVASDTYQPSPLSAQSIQLLGQPRATGIPVAVRGARGDREGSRSLFVTEAAKITTLEDLGPTRLSLG